VFHNNYVSTLYYHSHGLLIPRSSHDRNMHADECVTVAALRTVNDVLVINININEQELSYRKQIARKLGTQYVQGIYDNPVTL